MNTYRLVDPCAGANNIDLAKGSLGNFKHPFQLQPISHVGLLEDGSRRPGRVFLDQHLGLRAQRQVCDEDIASIFHQQLGEAEVDS